MPDVIDPHQCLKMLSFNALFFAAAQVQQMTNIRNKDLRKFLDGIYVTDKVNIVDEDY